MAVLAMNDAEKLENLLGSYAHDRMIMNAAYGLYKDYSSRIQSYESQIYSILRSRTEPLSSRELKRLHEIIDEKIDLREEHENDQAI
jgi:hypothetical protein